MSFRHIRLRLLPGTTGYGKGARGGSSGLVCLGGETVCHICERRFLEARPHDAGLRRVLRLATGREIRPVFCGEWHSSPTSCAAQPCGTPSAQFTERELYLHNPGSKVVSANITSVTSKTSDTVPSSPVSLEVYVGANKGLCLASMGLVCILYAGSLARLASDWAKDENYSHGYIVPFAFAWMLWRRGQKLRCTPVVPSWWGLPIVLLGVLQLMAGRLGAEYFVAHSSLLVVLAGVTLFLFGGYVLREVLFPIGWLVFMIPIPAIIFYALTFRLQILASRLASGLLDLLSVPNLREGNILYLSNFTVGVAEACSGIRSLIALLAVAVLLGHFMSLGLVARGMLLVSVIPTALGVNALRVAGTGIIGNYWGAKWAEGFFHSFSGWLLFIAAAATMLGIGLVSARFRRAAAAVPVRTGS